MDAKVKLEIDWLLQSLEFRLGDNTDLCRAAIGYIDKANTTSAVVSLIICRERLQKLKQLIHMQTDLFPTVKAQSPAPPTPQGEAIDITKYVQVLYYPEDLQSKWQVTGSGRRGGEIGIAVANVALKHSDGYEVILRFEDGKLDSFAPFNLMPPT